MQTDSWLPMMQIISNDCGPIPKQDVYILSKAQEDITEEGVESV